MIYKMYIPDVHKHMFMYSKDCNMGVNFFLSLFKLFSSH